ncbi:MAG: MFS transporter [Chloroflexi bacterium]|nr:MFS transporter [Chloroflexota bacterium]
MWRRDFRYLTFSSMAATLGMWMQSIGSGWLVLELTHSPVQMGIFSFVRGITQLLASPPAGVLADRWSRRKIIVITTLLGVLWAVALTALIVTDRIEIWHMYVLTILDSVTGAANFTARQAMIYDCADEAHLPNAVAVGSLAFNITRIIGPSLAGMLIGGVGLSACFIGQAAAWVVSALFTLSIRTPGAASSGKGSPWDDLRAGMVYSARDPLITGLLLAAVIPTMVIYPYVQYLPIFANDILKVGAQGYGILSSGLGFGSIVGSLLLAYVNDVPRKGLIMLGTLLIYSLFIIGFALSPWFPLAMGCLMVSGIFHSIYNALNNTAVQLAVKTEYRGRVMSLYGMTNGLLPFGALPLGFAIAAIGAPLGVAGFVAFACLLTVALGVWSPALRKL